MSDDLPYMRFFPADFLADCDVLSVSGRGAWHTFLCKAWLARSGSVSLKPAQWSRVFGATNVEQTERLIAEIEECGVGDVIREDDGRVTLISRRIERDLDAMGAKKKSRSNAARIAAEARWHAERMRHACETHPKRNASAMRQDAIPESRSQNPEERENKSTPSPLTVTAEILSRLKTVFPDAPNHLTAAEMHDMTGALSVLCEFTAEDWTASRAWVEAPERVRGRKLWPRNRAEFVSNAGEALEAIRAWWRASGRRWSEGRKGAKKPPSEAPAETVDGPAYTKEELADIFGE